MPRHLPRPSVLPRKYRLRLKPELDFWESDADGTADQTNVKAIREAETREGGCSSSWPTAGDRFTQHYARLQTQKRIGLDSVSGRRGFENLLDITETVSKIGVQHARKPAGAT